jgi:peptide/nickel transport system substrate-binding protein
MTKGLDRRTFLRGTIGAGSALLTAASRHAAAQTPPAKSTWTVAVSLDASGLDPAKFGGSNNTDGKLNHIMEGLTDSEGPDLKLVPKLATSWRRQADPTVWRFQLRKGVKFHNGQEFKASDVKYTLDVYQGSANKKNNMRFIQGVNVIDDHTVDIVLKQPTQLILIDLSRLFIVPEGAHRNAAAFAAQPIGTGPYQFVSWTRQDRMVLKAFDGYWRGVARPQNLILRTIPDATTRVAELMSGGVDIVAGLDSEQAKAIQGNPRTELVALKGGILINLNFNLSKPPFNDVRVRRALNLAIDRKLITETILGGRAVPATGPFSRGFLGFDTTLAPYPYDPKQAKDLLAQAGLGGGFKAVWEPDSSQIGARDVAQAIAGQFKAVGVEVELRFIDPIQQAKNSDVGTFEGLSSGYWGVQSDPDRYLNYYFLKPFNSIPRVTTLIQAAREQQDLPRREAALKAVGLATREEAQIIELYSQDLLFGRSKDVNFDAAVTNMGYQYNAWYDYSSLPSLQS